MSCSNNSEVARDCCLGYRECNKGLRNGTCEVQRPDKKGISEGYRRFHVRQQGATVELVCGRSNIRTLFGRKERAPRSPWY